ncbi:hypothetical protein PoB_004768600 [Plakobranchus ocellatus]|uniref:Uncharacterized protein n=1 Tax=Plakobranchus ocellatus TaxID=259542 RepID=A0AAV4BQ57_9GAST|nr:hypothetical protein PoB_004768600 [Plakobranchus ocellatus]
MGKRWRWAFTRKLHYVTILSSIDPPVGSKGEIIRSNTTPRLLPSEQLVYAIPQLGDLRLSGHPLGQGAGARTRDRWLPADLRADYFSLCHRHPASDWIPKTSIVDHKLHKAEITGSLCLTLGW